MVWSEPLVLVEGRGFACDRRGILELENFGRLVAGEKNVSIPGLDND